MCSVRMSQAQHFLFTEYSLKRSMGATVRQRNVANPVPGREQVEQQQLQAMVMVASHIDRVPFMRTSKSQPQCGGEKNLT